MKFSTVNELKTKLNRRIRDKYKKYTVLQRKYYKKVLCKLNTYSRVSVPLRLFRTIIKKIERSKRIKRHYIVFSRRLKKYIANSKTYGFGWHIFRRPDVKNDVGEFIYFMNNYVSKDNAFEHKLRNIQRIMLNPGPKIDSRMRQKLIDSIYKACLILDSKQKYRIWNEFQKYLKFKPTKNTLNTLIEFLRNRCNINAAQRQNYCKLQFQEKMNDLRRIQLNLNQPQIKKDRMYPDILLQILTTMTMSMNNTRKIDVLMDYMKSFGSHRLNVFRQKLFR